MRALRHVRARAPRSVLIEVLRRRRLALAVGCLASTVHQVCEALVPLAIGLTVERAVAGGDAGRMAMALGLILLLFAVLATGGGVSYWVLTRAVQQEAHRLRVAAVGRVLAEPGAAAGRTPGELLSVVTSDAAATARVLALLTRVLSSVAALAVTAVVLLRIDVVLGLCVVLAVPPLVVAVDAAGPRLEARLRERQQAAGLTAALAAELVRALKVLRGFGGQAEAARRYRTLSRDCLSADVMAARASALVLGATLTATAAVTTAVVALAAVMAYSGRIGVAQFVTVAATAPFVADPVAGAMAAVQQWAAAGASASRLGPLLHGTPPLPRQAVASTSTPVPDGGLRLRAVGVADVVPFSLDLAPGEALGVVAVDPAVASAFVEVLAGDRPPRTGEVYVGRTPSDLAQPRRLRRHVLAAPHAVHLFGRTVGEVLDSGRGHPPVRHARALDVAALGATTAARGAVTAAGDAMTAAGSAVTAARDAAAAELADGATDLSGGQRQRLALARAVAADAPVLVLHDPLTAVDAVTEDEVAGRLFTARRTDGGVTVVVTSSPPLLARCDRVLFIGHDDIPVLAPHPALLDLPDYAETVLR
ncbi:ABC transporter transmembrane domain-containing protein [Streptomyces ortus]|uniref:ABC transporter ATP-binding protein/permease n=1 Tax=Streptomyces ortus TaxID=2867268 RepID=A0ABT3VG32_9ACTN|nr:ABC transporter ATP-binding protein [Streptomyces ortus]MCX4238904.1 ABC transporter ATP-binding protein/permease [Streptomyces ortus]